MLKVPTEMWNMSEWLLKCLRQWSIFAASSVRADSYRCPYQRRISSLRPRVTGSECLLSQVLDQIGPVIGVSMHVRSQIFRIDR